MIKPTRHGLLTSRTTTMIRTAHGNGRERRTVERYVPWGWVAAVVVMALVPWFIPAIAMWLVAQ